MIEYISHNMPISLSFEDEEDGEPFPEPDFDN